MFEATLDNSGIVTPHLADADARPVPDPGRTPARAARVQRRGRAGPLSRRREPGPGAPDGVDEHRRPAARTRRPSPFQRICPLADCGNAFSRHFEPNEVMFVNPDLTIALHRDPVGDWFGSKAVSQWQPTGIGLADALLFDDLGPVGKALQTMILRPA